VTTGATGCHSGSLRWRRAGAGRYFPAPLWPARACDSAGRRPLPADAGPAGRPAVPEITGHRRCARGQTAADHGAPAR
jgi:hypothetical protein